MVPDGQGQTGDFYRLASGFNSHYLFLRLVRLNIVFGFASYLFSAGALPGRLRAHVVGGPAHDGGHARGVRAAPRLEAAGDRRRSAARELQEESANLHGCRENVEIEMFLHGSWQC